MSELKVKASGEYVIIEATARPQGSEIKSESGIVVGVRQHGEQPFYGKVVSVGVDVPAEAAERILGKYIPLPSAHMANVPDPDLVAGYISEKESKEKETKYVSAHYKAIQAIYEI